MNYIVIKCANVVQVRRVEDAVEGLGYAAPTYRMFADSRREVVVHLDSKSFVTYLPDRLAYHSARTIIFYSQLMEGEL